MASTAPDVGSFVANTRQSIRPAATAEAYAAGGRSVFVLPRTGLLSRIHVLVSGTMNVTLGGGTATLSPKGPWNLIRALRLVANQNLDVFRVSGFGAHILDVMNAGGLYEADDGQRSSSFSASVFNASVNDGANAWAFGITMNVAPNERDAIGLLMLQTRETQNEVQIEWESAAGGAGIDNAVVTTGAATATFAGTAQIFLETFSVPADPNARPDLLTVHQVLENVMPISGTGDTALQLLKANVYKSLVHVVELNGALNDDKVTRVRLRYNNADTPYDFTGWLCKYLQRRRYRRDLPSGVFVHDFAYQGIPGYGGTRDLVNADRVTELESVVTIDSTATLGAGNNFLRTIQEQFIRLPDPN